METTETDTPDSAASALSAGLAACPCGALPTALSIVYNGQGTKWANVSGDCCSEWSIEFRTEYFELETAECMALAVTAWNRATRAANVELTGAAHNETQPERK